MDMRSKSSLLPWAFVTGQQRSGRHGKMVTRAGLSAPSGAKV